MAKLVDANNPRDKYEPPICRFVSMIPLELDARRKRGELFHTYKIQSEPHYSCPTPSKKNGLRQFYAKVNDYEGLTPTGNKCRREELALILLDANMCIEHAEFAVRVMCADEKDVVELLPNSSMLVQIPREEAARIIGRELFDQSCVYIMGESPEMQKIRPATLKDTEEHAQPDSAMFMLGLAGLYPRGRITRITIDSEEFPA